MSYFDEIKDKAIFIRLPERDKYLEYEIDGIIDFPIVDESYFYKGWENNEHHYTTKYHQNIFLPKLDKILNIGMDLKNDFHVVTKFYNGFDISMLFPNQEIIYDAYDLTDDIFVKNEKYENFVNCYDFPDVYGCVPSEFHKLFRFFHRVSVIVNKTTEKNKKLLISCDSQMIPSIMPLSFYYKELWVFDNRRTDQNFEHFLKLVDFDDILIQLNYNPLYKYINNLQ